MAGMWELPEIRKLNPHDRAWKLLRHSITTTDYAVRVFRQSDHVEQPGSWIAIGRLSKLPLTGLSRKILRAADLL
jgi:hypothetical protein